MSAIVRLWIGILAGCMTIALAHADVPEPLDRFSLSLGGFFPTVDARVSASGPGIDGHGVSFQRDFNLDSHRTLSNARLEFIVFDNQGFSIGGYQYSKHAHKALVHDFQFDDGTDYDVHAFVDANMRLETFNAAWHWWLAPDQHDVVGLGLGAVYYDLRATVDGGVAANNASLTAHATAERSAVAPLLTLGWRHAFSEKLRGYAGFSGVRKPSGTLTGHLLNGTVGVDYFPWSNLGVALEYSANHLDLKADDGPWEGRARIHFHGPAAFVRLRF